MEHIESSKSLLSEIQRVKKAAIGKGTLREEKPLNPIVSEEIPYQLPNGWMWVRLGDYALKVTDYVASGSFASLKENVLITNEPNYAIMVKTADFANGFTKGLTYTDKHGYEFLSNSNLFGGELILSNIGSIGKVFIVPCLNRPMTLASNTVMVKVTNDELIKYLYYYFLSPLGQRTLRSISSGTSMMKFNKTQLKNTLVPVAPLSEQKYIVSLLERAQAMIELRRQQLAELDNLVKARFVEMFGDMDSNPKKWRESTVGQECYYIKDGPHKSPPYVDEGIPFISTRNVVNGDGIDWSTAKYISEVDYLECIKKCKPEKGNILYSKGGTTGIAKLIETDRRFANWVHVAVLKFGEQLNGKFFECMLNMNYCYQQSQRLTKGIANRDFILSAIAQVKIFVPPIGLQKQYEEFVRQTDKSKAAVQKALDEAQTLFDNLMQQYFG